eukprot:7056642-Pyramimonas_sp.AAC.1
MGDGARRTGRTAIGLRDSAQETTTGGGGGRAQGRGEGWIHKGLIAADESGTGSARSTNRSHDR